VVESRLDAKHGVLVAIPETALPVLCGQSKDYKQYWFYVK